MASSGRGEPGQTRPPAPGRKSQGAPDPKGRSEKRQRTVGKAITRWRAATKRSSLAPCAPSVGPNKPDDALAFLDDLEKTAVGREWLSYDGFASDTVAQTSDIEAPGCIAPLPRRKQLKATDTGTAPPMAKKVSFEAGLTRSLVRLVMMIGVMGWWVVGTLFDRIRRRDTIENRARRLRLAFMKMGATWVKLGQQLAVRADILPFEYCRELSKMLDAVPPFSTDLAIEAIEAATGEPITDTFAVFDPDPIGSASIACVYQALLKNGERVAVKVRRPHIGEQLAADLNVLGWMLSLAEGTTLIRPGLTRNLRTELHGMLMEELDFRTEARFTEIFGRLAKEQEYIAAPKVYFEHCGEGVIVTEYINGLFLSELLSALDRKDEDNLRQIREQGIDPSVVAQRMTHVFHWQIVESLLFHADPHPANIIIRQDNSLVFIDFGSCGTYLSETRRLWQELHFHIINKDVSATVHASLRLLEPLPPIDIVQFTKEIESVFLDWFFATESGHSEWWERSSGHLWLSFVGMARRYNIPMNLDTLRKFRTTLLYDSITCRLWDQLDLVREYRVYARQLGRRARKRVLKSARRRMRKGLTDDDFYAIEDLGRMSKQVLMRFQRTLDTPSHTFGLGLTKAAFGLSLMLRFVRFFIGLSAVAAGSLFIILLSTGQESTISESLGTLFSKVGDLPSLIGSLILAVFAASAFITTRKIGNRIEDVDVDR